LHPAWFQKNKGSDQQMENSIKATPRKKYGPKQNADGTIDICFRQQIIDPAMVILFLLPSLLFTSCSGIFAVDNTFGIPGGITSSIVLIVVLCLAGYKGIELFNSKEASIKIIPGKGIEFGSHALANSEVEKIGMQAGNIGANRFRVYALTGGEKIFMTEYVSASIAKAIQSGIQDCLGKI
jgi:hypothetical protein